MLYSCTHMRTAGVKGLKHNDVLIRVFKKMDHFYCVFYIIIRNCFRLVGSTNLHLFKCSLQTPAFWMLFIGVLYQLLTDAAAHRQPLSWAAFVSLE